MKILTRIRKFIGLAAASAASILAPANADAQLTANDGDIFLCFRATAGIGGNTGYLVNLGPVAQFTSAAGVVTVDLGGDILEDLAETYGEDWHTRADVNWSVSGVQNFVGNGFPAKTMFASKAESAPGTQSIPWTRPSISGATTPAGKMQSRRDGYAPGTTADQTVSTRNSKALIQGFTATNCNVSFMPGGSNVGGGSGAFSYYVNGGIGIESTFVNGASQSVLDFYKLVPVSGGLPAELIGGFRLNSAAQLTFSPDVTFFQGPANVHFLAATDSVNESVAGGKITLTVVRDGNTNTAFTVNFSTANGEEALAGTDFTGHTNTPIAFAAGETSKTVDVLIADRAGFQGDRSFTASISLASGVATLVNPTTETITILESTPQPALISFSAATYSVAEDAASGNATVTITRDGSMSGQATVKLSTSNGTAIAGTDYTAQSDVTVTFEANETSKDVNIPISTIAGFQGDRSFNVALSNPSVNAQLDEFTSAVVTILENSPNPAGTLAFSSADYRVGIGTSVVAVVTVERTLGTTGAVDVDVAIKAGGTLAEGEDFTLAPTTLNFIEGQASATLNIPISAGAAPLPGSFTLELVNPTNGASIGAVNETTVFVTTPDVILPKLVVTSPKPGVSGATVNVVGSVVDANDIDRVEVRLNGGAPHLADIGVKSGNSTPFTLTLNAENGPNVLLVQAFDINGTASKIVQVKFSYANVRENLVGTYNGLVKPTGATPPGSNPHNASGFFTIKVTKTGSFSGKVLIGGATLPIGGVIANDLSARFKTAFGPAHVLAIKGKSPVTIGELSFTLGAGEANGAIGAVATIHAERAAFDGKTPATTVPADYLENKGKYTAAIPSKAQAVLLADEFPQGDGIGNVTISKTGKVSFKGKLADGTPLSLSGSLSSDLEVALYVPLYAKKGSFAGVVKLDHTADDSDFEAEDCLWLRPAQATAKHYPAGWPSGLKADMVGASYAIQEGSSVLLGLGAEAPGVGNASFVAEAGSLTSTKTLDVNISATNKVTIVSTSDSKFRLKIVAPTGAFSGSFTHTDNTVVKYNGIILQKGDNEAGFGYFLSTVPRGATTGKAGGVSLSAK